MTKARISFYLSCSVYRKFAGGAALILGIFLTPLSVSFIFTVKNAGTSTMPAFLLSKIVFNFTVLKDCLSHDVNRSDQGSSLLSTHLQNPRRI
jgi:hypothetical protein